MADSRNKNEKYSQTALVSIPHTREDMVADKHLADKLGLDVNDRSSFCVYTPDDFSGNQMLKRVLTNLNEKSRLYISVHADEEGVYLGSKTQIQINAESFAKALAEAGLKKVGYICLVACEADKIPDFQFESFAKELHRVLGKEYGIYTELSAYSEKVAIFANENYPQFLGRKMVSPDGSKNTDTAIWAKNSRHKQRYTWEENEFGELEQTAQRTQTPTKQSVKDDLEKADEEKRNTLNK